MVKFFVRSGLGLVAPEVGEVGVGQAAFDELVVAVFRTFLLQLTGSALAVESGGQPRPPRGLRAAGCGLRAAGCRLQPAGRGLQG